VVEVGATEVGFVTDVLPVSVVYHKNVGFVTVGAFTKVFKFTGLPEQTAVSLLFIMVAVEGLFTLMVVVAQLV
jgi:hypothetical protein